MRLGSGEHYGWERPRSVELVRVLPGPELDREFALLRVPEGAKGGPLAVMVRRRVGPVAPWREPRAGERIQLQAWQLSSDDAALLELATELGGVERWVPPKPAPDLWLWVEG